MHVMCARGIIDSMEKLTIEFYLSRCITGWVDHDLLHMQFSAREIFAAVCSGLLYRAPVGTEIESEDDALFTVSDAYRVYIICN